MMASTPENIDDMDDIEPTDPTLKMVYRMAQLQRARDAESPRDVADATHSIPQIPMPFAAPLSARLASIERDLQRLENDGFFVSFPLHPENEFPTLLSRLPIFRPSRRKKQQRLQNLDNAIEFSTPFGQGKRYGPPLTIRDEDTLIALMRLRSRRLYGKPVHLPVSVPNIYETKAGRVGVHYVVCTLEQLNREMGLKHGGTNHRATLDSVKRLGATKLELNLTRRDRYLQTITSGRMFDLIHLQWETYADQGVLVVLFPPIIAQWLEKEYTYISWRVRRQLGDLGKALHRFLSSQPRTYRGDLLKIGQTIGYDGPSKNIRQRFTASLDELVTVGWLEHYAFSGSARQEGLRLETVRAKENPLPSG